MEGDSEKDGMSRPAPLLPAFDFASAPEPARLRGGTAKLDMDSARSSGPAEVLLRFLPSPQVVVRATVHGTGEPAFVLFCEGPGIRSFTLDGQEIEGFHGRWTADEERLELDWCPSSTPMAFGDMASRTSVSARLHLFNFPHFRGGRHQASGAPAGCSLLVLESDEWRTSLQSLPHQATQQVWTRIDAEGGCFLTHVGNLERKDGQPFSGDEAGQQRRLLADFLSFANGGRCSTVCEVGFDAAGARTWETLAPPRPSSPHRSWFDLFQASQVESLFPLFARLWQQSEQWKKCLSAAIYWYTQANTGGGSPGIDAAIILAHAALERLAHHHLVVDRKMISAAGLDQLKTSDRLRLLFSSLNIPVDIGDATPDIRRAAQTFRWQDAPHAMTDIRNELVHPVSRRQVDTCIVDAWQLLLWYLELSVLALCGYDSTYTSRLTARLGTGSEMVPWAR